MTHSKSFEDKLIDFLNEIPAMSQRENRDILLRNLPSGPITTITRSHSTHTDLSSIVQFTYSWGKLDSGELALLIVMNNTINFVQGLELKNRLDELILEFKSLVRRSNHEIEIPFIVVAMTCNEYASLCEQLASNNLDLFNDVHILKELIEILKENNIEDITERYSVNREKWKPYSQENTIEELVLSIIEHINSYRQVESLPLIKPKFISIDDFDSKDLAYEDPWCELRELGGVLLVDPISLFDPFIRKCISDAEISSNQRIAILTLSPFNAFTIRGNQLIESALISRMRPAFARFHTNLDKFCEICIGDLRTMKRWFFSVLPETAEMVTIQQPKVKNRILLLKSVGRRSGIDTLWGGNK